VIRSVIAVIAGWVVFGMSAALLFQLSGRAPHEATTTAFMIGSTMYGVIFAAVAGFLAAWLAPRRPLVHAGVVSAIIAAGAIGSFFAQPGVSGWSQMSALFCMAPAAWVGGLLFTRRAAVRP